VAQEILEVLRQFGARGDDPENNAVRFIQKPYRSQDLTDTVQRAIDRTKDAAE
jgi:hypothetical protein